MFLHLKVKSSNVYNKASQSIFLRRKMKRVDFYPSSEITEICVKCPKPASQYIPEWYKNLKSFSGESDKNKPLFENGNVINKTVKTCYPFFDALTSGYIQESWCDIRIYFENETFYYDYSTGPDPISHRNNVSIKISTAFRPFEFVWKVPWVPKLENGYSMFITNPLNRFDLPFQNTSGIIDSDKFFHARGNYPFYFYNSPNKEIFIPQGTPLYQMIPIKRDSWKHNVKKYSQKEFIKRDYEITKFFIGSYKKLFYVKKTYK